MKQFVTFALVAIASCRKQASIGPENPGPRASTAPKPQEDPAPKDTGANNAAKRLPSQPTAPAPIAAGVTSGAVSAAPDPWARIARLSADPTQKGAFALIGAVNDEMLSEKVPTQAFCYRALAYFSLNQITAGDEEARRCSNVPAAGAPPWDQRLASARSSADQRVADIVAKECGNNCVQAVSTIAGSGGCKCDSVRDKTIEASRASAAKNGRLQTQLHPGR